MTVSPSIVHNTMPSGFGWANILQRAAFAGTGSVHGASKVAMVRDADGAPRLAIRNRPPLRVEDILSGAEGTVAEYIRDYNEGFRFGKTGADWPEGRTWAYDDGFLDGSAGRLKWHTTYCSNHDECGE